MPVDLTYPLCIALSIALAILHFAWARNKYLLRAAFIVLVLPCLAYIAPLVVFHIGDLVGSPRAMQKLGSLYYLRTPRVESLGLHYYNKAIQSGSYDAKLELASILKYDAKRENANSYHSKLQVDDDVKRASLRQSKKWISAKELLESAARLGDNHAISELNEMLLEEDPMALGRGVFLIRHARVEAKRNFPEGSLEFYDHLKNSPEWLEGMSLLSELKHDQNRWLSDYYLFELLDISPDKAGEGAVVIGKEITSRGIKPLHATANERKMLIKSEVWKKGVSILKIQAERGDGQALDLLERIDLFAK